MATTVAISQKITLKIDCSALTDTKTIGLRGDIPPLSWEQSLPLEDKDGDGIFETTFQLENKHDMDLR